jgi:allophanate hydrolase
MIDLTIENLKSAYKNEEITPSQVVEEILRACDDYDDHNIWITLLSKQQIQRYTDRLEGYSVDELPLYGIPFAIKDNIDLAGVLTTAACPDFAYTPEDNAYVVEKLIEAGAIPIGKTNLDQFATGLVGVRSPEPWGPCKNSINPDYISGGSSSGSAVSVALGLVSFALGTDTAGSGRVPAAFNNIVGLKPSKGLFSTSGLVPACRSLDCITVFSMTTDDANTVFEVAAEFDAADPFSRKNKDTNLGYGLPKQASFSFATPSDDFLEFFGNDEVEAGFKASVETLKQLGGEHQTIDFSDFITAAKLLYEGPWVAERRIATEGVEHSAMHPVISTILNSQKEATAEDLFKAQYKLQGCFQAVQPILDSVDFIVTPTAGTIYTIEEVLADPVQLNSNLGYYTNFMNLLDCSAVAVPAGFSSNKLPFGITLFAKAFNDSHLLSFANLFQQHMQLKLGATKQTLPTSKQTEVGISEHIEIVVCGAHLQDLPLNYQLLERSGKLVKQCHTSANYRLYALAGGPPSRPGLFRDEQNGQSIEVEVWSIATATLGSFLANIPKPLGLGKVELDDGSWKTGFICEPYASESATDITHTKGWRNYI